MGSIILTIPDIPDANLTYNEAETRQILRFFWPEQEAAIGALTIDNGARKLAQVALIAAIDGSYAYGYIDVLFRVLGATRDRNILQLGRRLARNFIRHWWRHATQQNLEDVRIYEYVRVRVAASLRVRLDELKQDLAIGRAMTVITIA